MGHVSCRFSDTPDRERWQLDRDLHQGQYDRSLTIEIHSLGTVLELTSFMVRQFAFAGAQLWPQWYDGVPDFANPAECETAIDRIARDLAGVDPRWLRSAAAACQRGQIPQSTTHTRTHQLRQLRKTLTGGELMVGIFLYDQSPAPSALRGLASVAAWVAREASAEVRIICPAVCFDRPELDAIHSRVRCETERPPQTGDRDTSDPNEEPGGAGRVRVAPIIGRPHPASRGEQLLAAEIRRTPMLAPLFACNQPVETVRRTRYLVDLLWAVGRVIVEVDGYYWHSTPSAFHADRYRDYELSLSGYLVLRLPHDWVVEDPARACQQIVDFVQLRENSYPIIKR